MAAEARIKLCIEHSDSVYRSLVAEQASELARARGGISVRRDGNCVTLEIEAERISELRALVTSYLFLAYAAYSSVKALTSERS